MKKTINQIRVELNEIATKHGQINSFAWKDFLRAYKEKELNHPLMCAYYPTSNLTLNQTEIALTIIIADKIFKDWNKNLNDVESDTLQICRDIFNIINQSDRWQRIGRVSSCTVNKFIERGGDEVAGHTMTVNFLIRDNSGVCDIPIFDYDFDQVISAGCPVVNVFNSDLSYSQEVESGDSLELPDITYNVKNSADTSLKNGTIPSVNNLEVSLDDVNNIDSDGSTVPTPAGVPFTCTPAETVYIGKELMKTGQTVSYYTGDDGDVQAGRADTFFVLGGNNPFGNTNRFTDELGGQTYTNNIMIDWSTYDNDAVLGYYMNILSSDSFTNQISIISALNIGGFTNWRMWNSEEMFNALNKQHSILYNYSPLNWSSGFGGYAYTSTTRDLNFCLKVFAQSNQIYIDTVSIAVSSPTVAVRTFTVNGTTLT